MINKSKKELPKVGDEIWMPGGKRKVLSTKQDWALAALLHTKVWWVLVEGSGNGYSSGPSWFEWENNLDEHQEYFKEVFERRDCKKCQFPLPWDTCEVHG